MAAALAVLIAAVPVLLSMNRAANRGPAPGSSVQASKASFGVLPRPALAAPDESVSQLGTAGAIPYFGPAKLSVTATLPSAPSALPVFRFAQPSLPAAAATAKAYGARAVVPSTQPFREPQLQITDPKAIIAGGTPLADNAALAAANAFLGARGLAPAWPHQQEVLAQGSLSFVRYVRQFSIGGTTMVRQVDQYGASGGANVVIGADGKVLQANVPLALSLQSHAYPARNAADAAGEAVSSRPLNSAGLDPVPQVQLSQVGIVYVAMPGKGYGYFEPAYLFSGTFTVGESHYEKRVLIPALDSSVLG